MKKMSKKKKKDEHEFTISWSFCSKDIDLKMERGLDKIVKSFGGEDFGSGSGFGERDIQYGGFKSEASCRKAAQFVRSELRRQGRVSVHTMITKIVYA